MLSIQELNTPRDQREIFKSFDPAHAAWIVSDLRSKLDLQRELLSRRNFLPGEGVMRVSELWRALMIRLRPDLQLVSREFMLTLLAEKLSSSPHAWARAPGASQALFAHLTQLMPVLSHPDGDEMMKEWFSGHAAAQARWGRWHELAAETWRALLIDGFVATEWASGVLVNEPDLLEAWTTPLVIDLGAELDQVEADLFVALAERIEITVLKPAPEWATSFRRALGAYEVFTRKLFVDRIPAPSLGSEAQRPRRYRKYTTMIGEVKDATAQIREWLDWGEAKPAGIAIVAPDIEAYWPALSGYLEREGVPVQKARVRRAHTFPEVARWLAVQRLHLGDCAEADVELALFEAERAQAELRITYDKFKVLYSIIYGREDLARSKEVEKLFAVELEPATQATRDEFVAWSLKRIPQGDFSLDRLKKVFKRLFEECPRGLSFTARRWLGYVERLAARVEVTLVDGNPDGVACLNLGSATNSPTTHMIVLGLTEGALRKPSGTSILPADALSLTAAFGFHLSSDEQPASEFEARWLVGSGERELLLTVAETDFAGAAQAPSWLWIEGANADERAATAVPRPTRWDELQTAGLPAVAAERHWSDARSAGFASALDQDLGLKAPEVYAAGEVQRLSPSAIEDYLECPFIFAAKHLFTLSDVNELDLEVDPARRGSLMHKVFELLLEEPVRFDLGDEELDTVIERARESGGVELADPRLWPPLKARYRDLARRFLAFEREGRARFPATRTVGREVSVNGFIDAASARLTRERPEGLALEFRGRIDRVDSDEEASLAIYDYKSSKTGLSQYTTWLKNNEIQLLLYAMAVEAGLSDIPPATVGAALYYTSKPLGRDNGFKTTEITQKLFDTEDRKKNKIAPEAREKLFAEGREKIKTAVDGILAGRFNPSPRDVKACQDCRWSSICRAPHLSV